MTVQRPNANVLRVIVDEGLARTAEFVRRVEQVLASPHQIEWTYLSESHRGVPDVEILGKLLGPGSVLLTRDRILHNQAIRMGARSYFLDEHGQFRSRALPGVPAPTPLPPKPNAPLQSDYTHPFNPIASALKAGLSEREFKRLRTRRRRIRSYFGGEAQLNSASLTIGARQSKKGMICGFFLALAGTSGVEGIRASEGYALVQAQTPDPAYCVIHALRELFLLQLENLRTELFISAKDSFSLAEGLVTQAPTELSPASRALQTLLSGVKQVRVLPCVKGRFFDAMEAKLCQLSSRRSNELVPIAFGAIVNALTDRDGFSGISPER